MDRWVRIAHIYTGTDVQVYVDELSVMKRHRQCTLGKAVEATHTCDLACSIPGPMFVGHLRD